MIWRSSLIKILSNSRTKLCSFASIRSAFKKRNLMFTRSQRLQNNNGFDDQRKTKWKIITNMELYTSKAQSKDEKSQFNWPFKVLMKLFSLEKRFPSKLHVLPQRAFFKKASLK